MKPSLLLRHEVLLCRGRSPAAARLNFCLWVRRSNVHPTSSTLARRIVIRLAKGAKAEPPVATEGLLGPSALLLTGTGPRFRSRSRSATALPSDLSTARPVSFVPVWAFPIFSAVRVTPATPWSGRLSSPSLQELLSSCALIRYKISGSKARLFSIFFPQACVEKLCIKRGGFPHL